MIILIFYFFLIIRRPPRSTRTDTLFPYTTLFRSIGLKENGRNKKLVRIPPIAWAIRRTAGAQNAFIEAVKLRPVFRRLQALLARRRRRHGLDPRSEEHTSELQSLMRTLYAAFCLKKKNKRTNKTTCDIIHRE